MTPLPPFPRKRECGVTFEVQQFRELWIYIPAFAGMTCQFLKFPLPHSERCVTVIKYGNPNKDAIPGQPGLTPPFGNLWCNGLAAEQVGSVRLLFHRLFDFFFGQDALVVSDQLAGRRVKKAGRQANQPAEISGSIFIAEHDGIGNG